MAPRPTRPCPPSRGAGTASGSVADDDATTVTLATPGRHRGTRATARTTARITLTLGRGLRAGERLAVPLAFAGGAAGTDFTLALQGTPAGVSLSGSGTTVVTFTGPETGATAASAAVLLTAAQDDDAADDTVTVSIPSSSTGQGAILAATGLGGGATGSRTGDGTITLEDDDTAGLVFAPAKLTVAEGGTATYTVALATRPSAPVTVTVGGGSGKVTADTDADTGGDQSTLSFTTTNWATPQEVTVSGTADGDLADEDVTLTHTASGGGLRLGGRGPRGDGRRRRCAGGFDCGEGLAGCGGHGGGVHGDGGPGARRRERR